MHFIDSVNTSDPHQSLLLHKCLPQSRNIQSDPTWDLKKNICDELWDLLLQQNLRNWIAAQYWNFISLKTGSHFWIVLQLLLIVGKRVFAFKYGCTLSIQGPDPGCVSQLLSCPLFGVGWPEEGCDRTASPSAGKHYKHLQHLLRTTEWAYSRR